ncbi:hypothetical protein SEUCBS139899_001957 [Sporothrix eucalyptigena]
MLSRSASYLTCLASLTSMARAACVEASTDTDLGGCYPEPATGVEPLTVLTIGTTANGYTTSARGWNTWSIQSLADPNIVPGWDATTAPYLDDASILSQCSVLTTTPFQAAKFTLCSLDGGWSATEVNSNGLIVPNTKILNITAISDYLHANDLLLGVYVHPGVPCSANGKLIPGTDIYTQTLFSGQEDQSQCYFNYSAPGIQDWHNAQVALWASYGVDMIKLDFITPGSPLNDGELPCDMSAASTMYHNAIAASGRPMRLDLSWKPCRNTTWLPFWGQSADAIRTDNDINLYYTNTFTDWQILQQAFENYRQYILLQKAEQIAGHPIVLHPDMDNLLVANNATLSGITDDMRVTTMNMFLGASANLVLGGDLNNVDSLGLELLTSSGSKLAANFFAEYPMQPRNPGTGDVLPLQLQAWIAGPSATTGEAYVVVANYGPDQGKGGYGTALEGVQAVTVSLSDLGLTEAAGYAASYTWRDVWNGNGTTVTATDGFTAYLNATQSSLFLLAPVS